jgi:hypothetical protein
MIAAAALWSKATHRSGIRRAFKARIVNYADELVICCSGNAFEAMQVMRQLMGRLRLTIDEEKTPGMSNIEQSGWRDRRRPSARRQSAPAAGEDR